MIMDYIILVIVAFWLGANYASNIIKMQLFNLAKQKGIKIVEEPNVEEKQVPVFTIEQYGNLLYMFDLESNNFMCQGSSVDELADKLIQYHKIQLAIAKHGNNHIWLIGGKVSVNNHES